MKLYKINKIIKNFINIFSILIILNQSGHCNPLKEINLESYFDKAENISTIMALGYENAELNSGVEGIFYEGYKDAIEVSSENAHTGKYSLKTKVGTDDQYISNGKPRAESFSMNLLNSRYSEGEIWEYKFSLLLPQSWEIDNSRAAEIIWQFKRFNGSPDGFIAIKGDNIVMRVADRQIILIDKFKLEKWINFIIYVKWDSKNSGIIELKYKYDEDDIYIRQKNLGANIRNNKPNAGYLKWGLYRPDCPRESMNQCSKIQADRRIVFHDDISAKKVINNNIKR